MPQSPAVKLMAVNPGGNSRPINLDDSGNVVVATAAASEPIMSASVANNVPPIIGQPFAPGLFFIEGI